MSPMAEEMRPPPLASRPRTRKLAGVGERRLARPAAAASLLARLLDAPTRRFGFADTRLVADWPTIVGPEIAALALPVRIDRRGRRLVVHVRPAGALVLQHQEPQILERINAFFGSDVVWRLHLIQAPLPPPEPTAPPPPPLDEATRAAIGAEVREVEPAGLRAALEALGVALRQRRRAS